MTFEIKPNRIDSENELIALIEENIPAATPSVSGIVFGLTNNTNTTIGRRSLIGNTTGYNNVALGSDILYYNTSGYGNTGAGNQSLNSNSTGYSNTAVGYQALFANTTGYANTAVGLGSLAFNTTGYYNTAVGQGLYNNSTGRDNTAIGIGTLQNNTTGNSNTAVGRDSLRELQSGSNNTALGAETGFAGYNYANGSNNTMIGYQAEASSENVSNEVTIGNSSVNRFRVPGLGVDWKSSTFNFPGSILEKATVSATSATSTINYDIMTNGSVTYYTSNSSGNWTLNIRGNGSNTLNSLMSTGQSLTIAFLVTNGSTAYYQSGFQIDGSSVSPKWQGGTAPSSGNASSIDIYTITVIKTADATFTALAAQTRFA